MKNIAFCVLITLSLTQCSDEPGPLDKQNLAPAINSKSFTFTADSLIVPADNYSYSTLTLTSVDSSALPPSSILVFTTNAGTFANDSTVYRTHAALNGINRVYVKSTVASEVVVSASLDNLYTLQAIATFATALPSSLQITPSSGFMKGSIGSLVDITATLRRERGVPTQNQSVTFSDSTAIGSIGVFLNQSLSSSSGEVTVKYSLQDSTYRGAVYIRGTLNSVTGRTRILIVK